MTSIRLRTNNVLDLTDDKILEALGLDRGDLLQRIARKDLGLAISQRLGALAFASTRIAVLRVESRLEPSARNLVLFPERLGMAYDLFDPDARLGAMHPEIAEAIGFLAEGT